MNASDSMPNPPPKAFISYSWTSPAHRDLIRSYADRLRSDGVDVVLDQYDLGEGQDKYAFMEKMVTDPSVSHVLVFSDKKYAEKADARKAGVGTESQIMSKEIYDKVDQKKFIPLVCDWRQDGQPHLPAFFRARKWIDFSAPEKVNENWEQLIRALYGKPLHAKPALGKAPSYLSDDQSRPSLPTIGKFAALREAILSNKPVLSLYRQDFLDAALGYADSLRVRKAPNVEHFDETVLDTLRTLLPLRDQLVDWIVLEGAAAAPSASEETLINFLERLLSLKYRPTELNSWSEEWFDAHAIFVYEMFLYIIAALLRLHLFGVIHSLFTTHYMLPGPEFGRGRDFVTFDEFYGYSRTLAHRNERLKLRRMDPVADLVKERSTRGDTPFRDVMQAELVAFLAAALSSSRWYPRTLIYAGWGGRFPLFVRATQHKHFEKLKTIFGVSSADELRERFKKGCERLQVGQWYNFGYEHVSFGDAANMDALDTIQ
jgi:hypothetical protein